MSRQLTETTQSVPGHVSTDESAVSQAAYRCRH